MGAARAVLVPGGGVARAADIETVHRDVVRLAEEHGVRGGAYALIKDGTLATLGTFGHADAGRTTPVTPDTPFRVGLISKTVTSFLALALVEDGRLGPTTPVSALLPAAARLHGWPDDLRLVHLLEHTGGLPGSSFYEYARTDPNVSSAAYLASMRLRWPPDRYYSYANAGHTIAARMLEVAVDRPFDELVAGRVFTPFGMHSATFSTRGPELAVLSHSFSRAGARVAPWAMAVCPAGALSASARDMGRLALFLATDGPSVADQPVAPGRNVAGRQARLPVRLRPRHVQLRRWHARLVGALGQDGGVSGESGRAAGAWARLRAALQHVHPPRHGGDVEARWPPRWFGSSRRRHRHARPPSHRAPRSPAPPCRSPTIWRCAVGSSRSSAPWWWTERHRIAGPPAAADRCGDRPHPPDGPLPSCAGLAGRNPSLSGGRGPHDPVRGISRHLPPTRPAEALGLKVGLTVGAGVVVLSVLAALGVGLAGRSRLGGTDRPGAFLRRRGISLCALLAAAAYLTIACFLARLGWLSLLTWRA